MMGKKGLLLAIIGIVLTIGTSGVLTAQTTADPAISGYFLNINGQSSGPYDTSGLKQLISSGMLTRESLVWKEGMQNWVIAATVAELAPLFSTSVPPPVAAQAPASPPPVQQVPASPPPAQQQPAQQQTASSDGPQEPWGGSPALAGLINSAFGIWSWGNHDTFGGVMTTLLQVGGIACIYVGAFAGTDKAMSGNVSGGVDTMVYAYYGGLALFVGGTVFGVVRGVTQYNKKMAAYRSFAEAINDNPLNNISLVVFPTGDKKGVAGALTYSMSF